VARKLLAARFDGKVRWFTLAYAAAALNTTKRELAARVLAGEFRFQEYDRFGAPMWVGEAEVTAARTAIQAPMRGKPAIRKPRQKSPRQQEAEWAKISAANAKKVRDGPFLDLHLRMTLPEETLSKRGK
jgi:hypothetical protein